MLLPPTLQHSTKLVTGLNVLSGIDTHFVNRIFRALTTVVTKKYPQLY